MEYHAWLDMLVGLTVIVNPLLGATAYTTLTSGSDRASRQHTARLCALTVGAVLSVAALGGEALLRLFNIGLPEFQVGGGILLLLIAISMLHARLSPARANEEEASEALQKDQLGVVPIGIPILSGPGAISTVIIYAHQEAGWMHLALLIGEIWVVAGGVWLALTASDRLLAALGKTGINIATRIMGLLLAAIAVGFVTKGLKLLLPGLG